MILTEWFAPGFKAGGPIRSLINFVDFFHKHATIYILTKDRDLGENQPYPGINLNQWTQYKPNTWIYYTDSQSISLLPKLIRETEANALYLNGMYSPYFTLYPLVLKLLGTYNAKIVLAPRGMVRAGALAIKSWKKYPFLISFKLLGLHKKIVFQATDPQENEDLKKIFGQTVDIKIVGNVVSEEIKNRISYHKQRDELKVLFLGRIHPIKNLMYLLEILEELPGNLHLAIAGPIEDSLYWEKCKGKIAALSQRMTIQYLGELKGDAVNDTLDQCHIMALPTLGENFGHAIFEALQMGKPVLISDQTPWKGLEKQQAGWDISLADRSAFIQALLSAYNWDVETYNTWSESAKNYALQYSKSVDWKTMYLNLFQ